MEAFQIAQRAGARTIYNPAPAAEIPAELLRLTDILVPNEPEAVYLTGLPVDTYETAAQAAQVLRARGPRAVVITLGSRGALVVDEAGSAHIAAKSVAAVDTTGAGDAFVGSLAFYLARGDDLRTATHKSCLVATQSVLRYGSQTSFPYPDALPETCR